MAETSADPMFLDEALKKVHSSIRYHIENRVNKIDVQAEPKVDDKDEPKIMVQVDAKDAQVEFHEEHAQVELKVDEKDAQVEFHEKDAQVEPEVDKKDGQVHIIKVKTKDLTVTQYAGPTECDRLSKKGDVI